MSVQHAIFRRVLLRAIVGLAVALVSPRARAAEYDTDRADVAAALNSARTWLRPLLAKKDRSYRALYAYACLKLGVDRSDPGLAAAINAVAGHCKATGYEPSPVANHAVYVSGIEAMLLADAGGEAYQQELEIIRDFIIARQNDNGSWAYTKSYRSDMSVTQYAILGLWAAERAGAKVEPVVWARAVRFLLNAQTGGGFSYSSDAGSRADLNMTAAGLGSLVICRKHLSGGFRPVPERAAVRPIDERVRYGILRPKLPEEPEDPEPVEEIDPTLRISRKAMDTAIDNATKWIDRQFDVTGDKTSHLAYYYYTLERAGALSGRKQFRDTDWYDACADALLPQQSVAGSWNLGSYDAVTDTALVALFLARPTRKMAGRSPASQLGGGLLSGGRGLPSNLSNFGKPMADDRPQSPLEKLLADLAEAGENELPALQKDLVKQIQVGDREALIGQHETLAELVQHENADVRRTALWAMGRTGDLRLARYPIAALDDRDVTVLTEARNALAWIARRPESFGHAENPLAGVPPGATIEQKLKAVEKWRDAMIKDWGRWYLSTSPYDDRFDEFDLDLRARLSK